MGPGWIAVGCFVDNPIKKFMEVAGPVIVVKAAKRQASIHNVREKRCADGCKCSKRLY